MPNQFYRLRTALLALLVMPLFAAMAAATALEQPSGHVVLTVRGDLEHSNSDGEAQFDRTMLEELNWQTVESHTTWTDGPQEFSGVLLRDILDRVGGGGSELVAIALNDYRVSIPIEDAADHGILLALDHNGRAMRVRDKGPIWLIYPQTEADLRDPQFDEFMIWQLAVIEIIE